MIKDSGTRRDFGTGAVRDAEAGKGRFDLLPMEALWELAKVFQAGAAKYKENNWKAGIPLSAFIDSGMRHLTKYQAGWTDEPHLSMCAWNMLCLLDTARRINNGELPKELDDLYGAKYVSADMLFPNVKEPCKDGSFRSDTPITDAMLTSLKKAGV